MTWDYQIIEVDKDDWALVEMHHVPKEEDEHGLDGSYTIVFQGGLDRSDIVHSIHLMACDIFTDEEMRELDGMFKVRKEVKKLKGLV